jgi:hypothetical protein
MSAVSATSSPLPQEGDHDTAAQTRWRVMLLQAQQFISDVEGVDRAFCRATKATIRGALPCPGFRKRPLKDRLALIERRWRTMPDFGRLRVSTKRGKDTLQITEVRLTAARARHPMWDVHEPLIAIARLTLRATPRTIACDDIFAVAIIGAHACARCLQRGSTGWPSHGFAWVILRLISGSQAGNAGQSRTRRSGRRWRLARCRDLHSARADDVDQNFYLDAERSE